MTTEGTIRQYYEGLNKKEGWQSVIADQMAFNGPKTKTNNKDGYIEATNGFLRTVRSVTITRLFTDGNNACAIAHYDTLSPKGNQGSIDIAEIFTVDGGRITSSSIYFDTAAFREFLAN